MDCYQGTKLCCELHPKRFAPASCSGFVQVNFAKGRLFYDEVLFMVTVQVVLCELLSFVRLLQPVQGELPACDLIKADDHLFVSELG